MQFLGCEIIDLTLITISRHHLESNTSFPDHALAVVVLLISEVSTLK